MNYNEDHIQALIKFFESGCKREQLLGLELEHFVVDARSGRSLPYSGGVELILEKMAPNYGQPILSGNRIIGIKRDGADITLEPAAQLEVSIGPYSEVSQIARTYEEFTSIISPILKDMGCKLICLGYQPVSRIDELLLIPKERYKHMEAYFESTGTCGKHMMKGTAATQVSIDYRDEEDFKKKFRVANIMGPFLSLMYDNAPTFDGKPAKRKLLRTFIWDNVDPARAGIATGALDSDFGFYEYAKYVLDAPVVFEVDDFNPEHITSMVFPDVRLKTNIEIRMVDSIPIDQALDYTKLLKDIFYNEARLNAIYKATLGVTGNQIAKLKEVLYEEF